MVRAMFDFLALAIMRQSDICGTLGLTLASGSGHQLQGRSPGPHACIKIHDRATFLRLVIKPDLAFGEAYMDGWPDFDRQWRHRRADGAADAEFASLVEALGRPFDAALRQLTRLAAASQPALALNMQRSPPLRPEERAVLDVS